MNNQKIIVMVGISGSGKSTWAADFIQENPNYIRVNRDSIRQQITSSDSRFLNPELEILVTKIQDEQIRVILGNGYNLIIDNTHLKEKYINEIVKSFNHLADIELKVIPTSIETAKSNVNFRDNIEIKDLKYIDQQYDSYCKLPLTKKEFLFYPKKEIISYIYTSGLQECIICDLDGTLSLYDSNVKSAYDRDFENDTVNLPISSYLEEVAMWKDNEDNQSTKIIFFSGRNAKFRDKTIQFIKKAIGWDTEFTLIMREEKDMRRDSIVKLEMFDTHIRDKFNVLAVFDDRLQVIEECWNPLRVFVFNCNQGNKRF